MLRLTDDTDFLRRQSLVKELFDDKTFDPKNPVGTLNRICDTGTPTGDTWRDLLIKYPLIMGYSQQGFIGFFDDYSVSRKYIQEDTIGIIPFYQSQTNHLHLELFTFALGIELGVGHNFKNYDFEPFEYAQLVEQKVNNQIPYLWLKGYMPFTESYDLAICARINAGVNAELPDKWELNHYEFCFFITSETNAPEKYEEDVVEFLSSKGYQWRDGDYPGYYLTVSPAIEAAKNEISELLEALKSLKEEKN